MNSAAVDPCPIRRTSRGGSTGRGWTVPQYRTGRLPPKPGFAIGSGAVESANRVLVTARMKRSRQSWGRDGGQGVLTFRSLLRFGRFGWAWAAVAPRLNRYGRWKPPQCANDSQPVERVALAA